MRKAYPEDSFPAPTVPADPKLDLPKQRKTMTPREGDAHRNSGWGVHQQDEQR